MLDTSHPVPPAIGFVSHGLIKRQANAIGFVSPRPLKRCGAAIGFVLLLDKSSGAQDFEQIDAVTLGYCLKRIDDTSSGLDSLVCHEIGAPTPCVADQPEPHGVGVPIPWHPENRQGKEKPDATIPTLEGSLSFEIKTRQQDMAHPDPTHWVRFVSNISTEPDGWRGCQNGRAADNSPHIGFVLLPTEADRGEVSS